MPSTDPVSSITNCYRLIVSYCPILTQYTASSSRNAQLSQLALVVIRFEVEAGFDVGLKYLGRIQVEGE